MRNQDDSWPLRAISRKAKVSDDSHPGFDDQPREALRPPLEGGPLDRNAAVRLGSANVVITDVRGDDELSADDETSME